MTKSTTTALNGLKTTASQKAFDRACKLLPGGVNSPVRAYKAVGGSPIFIRSGQGCRVTDLDGNQFIDYVGSYGPLILGHAHEKVLNAITQAAQHGTSFGMPTEAESELAQLVIDAVPSIEIVRFVNSGTEATMSAVRLARAATGREKIIKCTGCYHGHSDSLLTEAGSGATTLGIPSSPGIPPSVTSQTLLMPFNDLDAAKQLFQQYGEQIAGILIEPIAGNMGCIPPVDGYLQGLRELCDQYGSLLIFDEVMTGFRVAFGGAQSIYNVMPDLTCLGKIVGGGLPCAAYGGREAIMRLIAPDGPVYQAGTLSGNPIAMAAGIATLHALKDGKIYTQLERQSSRLVHSIEQAARDARVPMCWTRVGSMVCGFFHAGPVLNYEQALKSDTKAFARFFSAMLQQGVVLPPSQFETWFISAAHDDTAVQQTFDAAATALSHVTNPEN